MRRKNNAYNQQVTLFVGTANLIILNNTRQIGYALRTIRLTQKILYTYHPTLDSSKVKSKYITIPLEQLIRYEYQYMIKTNMRPKLLLEKHDEDIKMYLRELKAPELRENQNCNIVAIAIEDKDDKERNYINGFIFAEEDQALNFYQALNHAITSQLYFQLAQISSLPFNYKLSNFLGDALNGRCIIDPQDYSEQKVEEQIKFILQVLSMTSKQKIHNFRDGICKLKLNFKVIDQESRNYACNFISVMEGKIQNLVLSECQLNTKEFTQIMEMSPCRVGDKMNELLCLDLSRNNLNDDFFLTAKTLITTCKKLHNFNLSHNSFTFQKQSIIISFLTSINTYKVILNVSNNKIKNTQFILKYFINAEGINPVDLLNISNNAFEPEDIASIANCYLQKTKKNENILKVILNQIQFQDARSFQFLTRQHRITAPTVLNVPLSLSKHPFRKKGKQLGNNQQDLSKITEIDQLIKKYGTEIFYGNFYKMKQLKDKLLSLKVDEQAIQLQLDSKHLKKHRKMQQQMIIEKMEAILNFKVKCKDVINELNETITFVRRKGLVGRGVGYLAYMKYKVEQKLAQLRKQNSLGQAYRQCLFNNDLRYTNIYLNDSEMMQLKAKYPIVVKFNYKELMKAMYEEQGNNNTTNCLAYSYLLLQESPVKYQRVILEHLLIDPLLSTARIIRNNNIKRVIFQQSQRVAKVTNIQKISSIEITSKYGLESYRFDQTFIQSLQSSSQYKGMLSACRFEVQHEPTINQFLETFYNFMVFLYLTPQEISQQTTFYIKQITQQLMMRQNQKENDLKCILIEQFIIRMITFFDSSKHRPLKHGLLLSICQFILRRIEIQEQLRLRLITHFLKYDNFKQEQIHFHVTQSKMLWQGKIDWLINEASTVKELIIKRGKLEVSIADISNQNFRVPIQIDELDTATDLWQLVKQNIQKIGEHTNINKNELDFYWLAGKKTDKDSWDLEFLPSYEHIGKLIFQDRFSKTFFLKRTVFPPQYHSTAFLKQLKYQDLLCLFQQARQNYRQSAHIIFGDSLQTVKVKLTADIMWIETLIQEQIVLVSLRRQQSEESLKKYQKQRQQINTKSLDKLHAKYMPSGSTFNQQNRNSLIAELQYRIKEPPPKMINQTIRENIVNLISNLGVCAFTTTVADSNKTSIFYCNNKLFFFEDKSQIPSKKIYVHYKHLLWFQVVNQVTPYMKFDIIENMSQSQVERYSFTIHGSSCWLGQVYSLIVNICNLRLNFPGNLLCCLQDSKYGVSDSILVSQTNGLLDTPPLQVSNLFEFKLPRQRRKQIVETASNIYEQLPPSLEEQQISVEIQRNQSKKQMSQIIQKQLPVPIKKQQKPTYSINPNQNFKQRQSNSQPLKPAEQIKLPKEVKEISLPPQIKKQQKPVQQIKSNQNKEPRQQNPSTIPKTQTQPKIPLSKNQQLSNNMTDKSKYNSILSIPQQSVESSSRRPSQQSLQIEQIIQATNNPKQKQDEDQVVPARRSSARSANNNNSRRKSRNR